MLRRGFVEAGPQGLIEVLLEHLGGNLNDETGNFGPDFGEHLGPVGFDGVFSLRNHFGLRGLGGSLGPFDGLIGGEACFGEDLDDLVGGGCQPDFRCLMSLSQVDFSRGAVRLKLFGLADAFFELTECGLDGETIKDEREKGEIDKLDEKVRAIDAEGADDGPRLGLGGVGTGDSSRCVGGLGSKEGGE